MNKPIKIAIAGVAAVALAAWLAFGFFGIQAAFIDNEVSEANPFADVVETPAAATVTAPPDAAASAPNAETVSNDPAPAESPQALEAAPSPTRPAPPAEPTPVAPAAPEIVTLASGSLVDHAHAGDGTVTVITDGDRRFLRFEDDFAIDNGPDLNVYLVRGVDAEGDSGLFDDDFIDLGDLKGNVGAQNYELDDTIDLSEYDTLVIWCVRFGVAFNAANLS